MSYKLTIRNYNYRLILWGLYSLELCILYVYTLYFTQLYNLRKITFLCRAKIICAMNTSNLQQTSFFVLFHTLLCVPFIMSPLPSFVKQNLIGQTTDTALVHCPIREGLTMCRARPMHHMTTFQPMRNGPASLGNSFITLS